MVGVVQIHLIGRIRYSVFLLQAMPTAQGNVSSAHHGVSTDVVVLFDCDHRRPMIASRNRSA